MATARKLSDRWPWAKEKKGKEKLEMLRIHVGAVNLQSTLLPATPPFAILLILGINFATRPVRNDF
ncbi:MAG: hypothetical protein INR71_12095 [Terriglobus roseus]|nr:hypothetical protein [Terriglobus roseus]